MRKGVLLTAFFQVIIAVGILVGCQSSGPKPTISPTHKDTVKPFPTRTATVVNISTPDHFQAIAATLTARPPRLSLEQQKMVVELIRTNGGCELPCFWGMRPGETEANFAHNLLEDLGGVYIREHSIGGLKSYARSLSYNLNQPKGVEVVLEIPVYLSRTEGFLLWSDEADYADYEQDWAQYSIRSILERFGTPDDIYLRISPVPGGQELYFEILLIKRDAGIAYRMWGFSLDRARMCPVLGEGGEKWNIQLFIRNVDGPLPILPPGWPSLDSGFWLPIEDVLGIDEQVFTEHIISTRPACFSVEIDDR